MESKEDTPSLCDECGQPRGTLTIFTQHGAVCSVKCEDALAARKSPIRRKITNLEAL